MVTFFISFAFAQAIVPLNQKDVAVRVLTESYQAKESILNSQLTRLQVATAESLFDWNLNLTSGYQLSRFQNFSGTANPKDEFYTTTLSLQKPLPTGTTLGVEFKRQSVRSELATGGLAATYGVDPNQTMDTGGITLSQNLWSNFFGKADRATVKAARQANQASEMLRANNLQNVVLDGLRLFWRAYVAQETFKESLNSRDRYEKLFAVVKKKNSLGYANPGEKAQVEAELESRNQNVKRESTNYLALTDQLVSFLKLPAGSEIKFSVSEEIPPLPSLSPLATEKLRSIESAKLSLESSENTVRAEESKNAANLNLVANYYTQGINSNSQESFNELMGRSRPQYYVGFNYQYKFGSGLHNEAIANARIKRDLSQTALARKMLEVRDGLENAQRRAQSTYSVALSMKKQKDLRAQAASELQKAYNQGRTDIRNLIDALNAYFTSEIQFAQAVGDYQLALNEWAAVRDELIPSETIK